MTVLEIGLGLLIGMIADGPAPGLATQTVAVRLSPGPYYVGQGVGLEVTAGDAPLDPATLVEPPHADGAEVVPLPRPASEGDGRPNPGVRFVLIPRRTGEVRVGPVRVRPSSERKRTGTSRPVVVAVCPIPQVGRSAGFLGGVGPCRVAAVAEPTTLRVGQTVEYRITLTGSGAWGNVQPPDLGGWADLPTAFEVQATGNQVEPAVSPTRTYRYRLRPTRAGTVVLPPVSLATFDPDSRRFQTWATSGIPVTVEPLAVFDPARVDFGMSPPSATRDPLRWISLAAGTIGILIAMIVGRHRAGRANHRGARPVSWRHEATELERWARREWRGLAVTAAIDERLSRALSRASGTALAVLTPGEAAAIVRTLTGDDTLAARVRRLVTATDRLRFDADAGPAVDATEVSSLIAEAATVFRAIGRSVRPSRPDRPSGKRPVFRNES